MTISAAIKRLQYLEDVLGVQTEVVMVGPEGERVSLDESLVFDGVTFNNKVFCGLMPQSYYETIAPMGIDHKPV